jgi:3-isopropylmalate dehydrogenase
MMLSWLGEHRKLPALEAAGQAIEAAVDRVLADPASRTRDLGGTIGTREFGERVANALADPASQAR